MTAQWSPFREPLRRTLLRTFAIALVLGAVLARSMGGLQHWPLASLMVLWFTFGGHWVEVFFLNWLRPRLPVARAFQIAARVVVWFIGGVALGIGAASTPMLFGYTIVERPAWWMFGVAFVVLELLVHLLPQLRGGPSFYNGRG